jgi:RNA polymerase sigma factor (sigma-70 family)
MDDDGRSDEELLMAARSERHAFALFYRRHAVVVYGWFAVRVTRDPDALDDLTAETFAQALLGLPRFHARGEGSAVAWLYGIARNQQRQFYRRRAVSQRARKRLGMPTPSSVEYDESEERELAEQLRPAIVAALAALPATQREAVELRVVGELDYASVADRIGCSEQAARVRVFRGLRALHVELAAKAAGGS